MSNLTDRTRQTEPTQKTDQLLSHEQAVQELRAAYQAGDVARTRNLFETTPLTVADANFILPRAKRNIPLMRCLLEQGADPNACGIRLLRSLDALKLLTEFGYDIKSHGHLVLQ